MEDNQQTSQASGLGPEPAEPHSPQPVKPVVSVSFGAESNQPHILSTQPTIGSMNTQPVKNSSRLPFANYLNSTACGLILGVIGLFMSAYSVNFILDSYDNNTSIDGDFWLLFVPTMIVSLVALVVSLKAYKKYQTGLAIVGIVISTILICSTLFGRGGVSLADYISIKSAESSQQGSATDSKDTTPDLTDSLQQQNTLEDTDIDPDAGL